MTDRTERVRGIASIAGNWMRVLLCGVWTGVLGMPLMVVIYARYAYGLVGARLGRRDVLDRVLEANAWLAGWVAQRLWAGVLLALTGIRRDYSVSWLASSNPAKASKRR